MKLDAPDWECFVFYSHDFPLLGFGGDFQTIRQAVPLDHERMVASRGERIGHPCEQIFSIVLNKGGFAMHHPVIYDDVSAKNVADALMSEANAKRRDV